MVQSVNTPPSVISWCVSAGFSTPMPNSFGSKETWVTQLVVMPLSTGRPSGPGCPLEPTT
jgi:hypothetical protein